MVIEGDSSLKDGLVKIERALISVSNKSNLLYLANLLSKRKIEIISTGGTSKFLMENGYKIKQVSKLTGFPEILNGRVKTLHPGIHAPILFDRDDDRSVKEIKNRGLSSIDLVVVNLYPFEEKVRNKKNKKEIVENIDIGGVALIRAAAKNFNSVTVLTDTNDYKKIEEEFMSNNGRVRLDLRRFLAGKALLETAYYDKLISEWMLKRVEIDEIDKRIVAGKVAFNLKYGENPHQKATYVKSTFKNKQNNDFCLIKGESLSFNNLMDITAAYKILSELNSYDKPASAIIKHNNPCGVAVSENVSDAYLNALNCDNVSAFGGIVCINRKIDEMLAKKISSTFTEIVCGIGFDPEALKVFSSKKNLKIVKIKNFNGKLINVEDLKSVIGGNLIQTADNFSYNSSRFEIVTKAKPSKRDFENLIFLWKTVKHVKSNAIVLGKNFHTTGIGAGQTNRVRSVKIAIQNSNESYQELNKRSTNKGLGLASDAFIPFPDSLEIAAENGIFNIIQPGGSKKDKEIIETANRLNQKMVFTKIRHFSH